MSQPHQLRVIEEHQELNEKLSKLSTFIKSDTFMHVISNDEANRLIRQAEIMKNYSDILSERINAF